MSLSKSSIISQQNLTAPNSENNCSYEFEDFRLDSAHLMLYRNGKTISLKPKVVETLVALVERRGEVVSKNELMNRLWADSFVEESNLTQNIYLLRKTLGDCADGRPFIENFSRRGYRFNGKLKSSAETSILLATHTNTQTVIEETIEYRTRRNWLISAVALIAVFGAIAFAVKQFIPQQNSSVLTDKDVILIADFDNKTGDEIFDGTLKQGLAIQLRQSPFLSLFPDNRVSDTLKLMNRSPEERITKEIGREICQRQGLKALVVGTIAPLGRGYVLTLEAVISETGEVVASEQAEAESKEQVLSVLGESATSLREKLGEKLSTIQKFDAPLKATTSSLEALKAYSLGRAWYGTGNMPEAIRYFNRAVEIDPNFALAYHSLAFAYANNKQSELSAQCAEKAYELRDRVSEHERLTILDSYYGFVTGEMDKRIENAELRKRLYPNDPRGFTNLSLGYMETGQFEKVIPESLEALRLDPNSMVPYVQLGGLFIRLNRFAEAGEIFERARLQNIDHTYFHRGLYQIAFASGDTAAMQQQLDWAKGKPDEYVALDWQTDAAAFAGQWRRAQDLSRRSIDLSMRVDAKEVAAGYADEAALLGALFGQCTGATRALALALCGETSQAQRLVDERVKGYPENTRINGIWAPPIRAAIELQRGNAAQAIEQLQPATRYEAAAEFWPQYLRGTAYLKLKRGEEAAAEFQKILDHRGEDPFSPLYPLARLGLGRAYVLQGDNEKAQKAYEDFFALWKDADADLPALIEAKREFAKLTAKNRTAKF